MIQERKIAELLKAFDAVGLDDINGAELMKRTDTKFIFTAESLIELLPLLINDYKVLEIEGNRYSFYENLYFDSPELKFYHDHQRRKMNRYKVRLRKYSSNDLCFLEIKFKNNKGVTTKDRKEVEGLKTDLDNSDFAFIRDHAKINTELSPACCNQFNRISLLSKTQKERLTLDFSLSFFNDTESYNTGKLVIAELKQERVNRKSAFYAILKKKKIYPFPVSKYLIGMNYLNEDIKSNRYKSRLIKIKKLISDDIT